MKTVKPTNARTAYRFRYRLKYSLRGMTLMSDWFPETKYYASLHKKKGNEKAQSEIIEYVRLQCAGMEAWCVEIEIYRIEDRVSNCWLGRDYSFSHTELHI